jgi:hypothetical protein
MWRFSLFAFIGIWAFTFPAHAQFGTNVTASADGNGNLALGSGALSNEIAYEMEGDQCFMEGTTMYACGKDNVALAPEVLADNTTGSYNTASGYQALTSNTTGNYNTASGFEALHSNATGVDNTALGSSALYNNKAGSNNSAFGTNALYSNQHGNYNTAAGQGALRNSTSGSSNTAVGYQAGYLLTTGSNNIDIGNEGAAADAAFIKIGIQGTQTATYIAGIQGTSVSSCTGCGPVYIGPNGQLGVGSSSERFKSEIEPMGASTENLEQLRPVTFRYKSEPQGSRQYGLIAEEVAKVYPELVIRNLKGEIISVRYDELAPMLLNEAQQQASKIRDLEQQVAELKNLRQELRAALLKLQTKDQLVAQR